MKSLNKVECTLSEKVYSKFSWLQKNKEIIILNRSKMCFKFILPSSISWVRLGHGNWVISSTKYCWRFDLKAFCLESQHISQRFYIDKSRVSVLEITSHAILKEFCCGKVKILKYHILYKGLWPSIESSLASTSWSHILIFICFFFFCISMFFFSKILNKIYLIVKFHQFLHEFVFSLDLNQS